MASMRRCRSCSCSVSLNSSHDQHLLSPVSLLSSSHSLKSSPSLSSCPSSSPSSPASSNSSFLRHGAALDASAHHQKPSPQSSCLATLRLHRSPVSSLISADGFLYSAALSDDLCSWLLPYFLPRLACSADTNSGSVKAMAASADAIFTAHQDGKIRVWRSSDFKLRCSLPRPRDCFLKSLSQKNYVQIRRREKTLWIQHADAISCLAVAGTDFLYSGSWDRTVKVWSVKDLKCLESFRAHDDAVNAIATSRTGDGVNILYTGSADGSVKVWRWRKQEEEEKRSWRQWRWWGKEERGKQRRRHVCVAKLTRGGAEGCRKGASASVNALVVSRDGGLLFSAGSDGVICVWGAAAGKGSYAGELRATVAAAHKGMPILCLSIATMGTGEEVLISGAADNTARLWRRLTPASAMGTKEESTLISGHGTDYDYDDHDHDHESLDGLEDLLHVEESLPEPLQLVHMHDEFNERKDFMVSSPELLQDPSPPEWFPEQLHCDGVNDSRNAAIDGDREHVKGPLQSISGLTDLLRQQRRSGRTSAEHGKGSFPEKSRGIDGLNDLLRRRNNSRIAAEHGKGRLPESPTEQWQCIGELIGHCGAVKSVAVFSPPLHFRHPLHRLHHHRNVDQESGFMVYTGSADKSIKVWWFSPSA